MQYKGQDKSMSESGAFEERALSSDSLHSVGTSLDLSLVSSDGGTEGMYIVPVSKSYIAVTIKTVPVC